MVAAKNLNRLTDKANEFLRQGNLGMACEIFSDALKYAQYIYENDAEIDKQDNEIVLICKSNLASCYCSRGMFDKAEPLFLSCYQVQLTRHGAFHDVALGASNNLSCCYVNSGKLHEAHSLLQDALNIYRDTKGLHAKETLLAMNNLGNIHCIRGEYTLAEELFKSVLHVRQSTLSSLDPYHPDLLISQLNLGNCYKAMTKLDLAAPLLQSTHTGYNRKYGPTHTNTITAYSAIADLKKLQGDHHQALTMFLACVDARKRMQGEQHPETLQAVSDLAACYAGHSSSHLSLFFSVLFLVYCFFIDSFLITYHTDTAYEN